jgi:hypothetical protein
MTEGIPEISKATEDVLVKLSMIRLGMEVLEMIPVGLREEREAILTGSVQEYMNFLARSIEAPEFTLDETRDFMKKIWTEFQGPAEAAYYLQQITLAKSEFFPEAFRDPMPLRTLQDLRVLDANGRALYTQRLKMGIRD